MQKKNFTQKIISWYQENRRNLPWRETSAPYSIWLSEIILQQTRVAQGIPYYLKFIERFPTLADLAKASEQDVLRLWQGLGYYTRARNLHRCSKVIVEQHGGKFPDTYKALLELPGIGSYTAAAIASIAFKEPVAVVDGNVFRVLSRVFGIELDISKLEGKTYFFAKASELISHEHPDEFNQALMEFGATVCLPVNPKCHDCIFKISCIAFANDWQTRLPVKSKKIKSRKRYLYYFVIIQRNKLLLKRRIGKDIWRGLYDFYAVETTKPVAVSKILAENQLLKKFPGKIIAGGSSVVYKHLLTHQTLFARFIPITLASMKVPEKALSPDLLKFYSAAEIYELPKPVLVDRYLSESGFL